MWRPSPDTIQMVTMQIWGGGILTSDIKRGLFPAIVGINDYFCPHTVLEATELNFVSPD